MPSPSQPRVYLDDLLVVASTASNDVWAVGTIAYNATLIEHWDGTAWTQITSPQYRHPRPHTHTPGNPATTP